MLDEVKVHILETKLDILIDDFKLMRSIQQSVNSELLRHMTATENTLKWYRLIGGGMVTAITALGLRSVKVF